MFISVIIPVYNGERYVKQAVESVLSQPCKDLEVICVNDGSRDGSLTVLKQISDIRLYVIDQENTGVAGARNRGICEAKGRYVAFLDQDDFWCKDVFTDLLVNELVKLDTDIVSFGYYYARTHWGLKRKFPRTEDSNIDPVSRLGENYRHHSSYLFKRELLVSDEKIEVDPYRHEDERFRWKCFFKAKSLSYRSEYLFVYQNNSDSVTHQKKDFDTVYESCISGYIYLEEETEYDQLKVLCNDTILHLFLELSEKLVQSGSDERIPEYMKRWEITERFDKHTWMNDEDQNMWSLMLDDIGQFSEYCRMKYRKTKVFNGLKSVIKKLV